MDLMKDDAEKYKPIIEAVQNLSNLSNTMDSFIANVIQEIDESRGQLFDIFENMAFDQAEKKLSKTKK